MTDARAQNLAVDGTPTVIRMSAGPIATSPEARQLVEDVRRRADAFVFLCGGASGMARQSKQGLLALLSALSTVGDFGLRIAVGDGGTQAGIMEAAGLARRASGRPFPLIGVSPALEILPLGAPGRTPVDPNHTHIVAVDNPEWVARRRKEGWTPDLGYWGSETDTMYALFARLAEGKPSVTLVANGGTIALDEVAQNVRASRRMIVVAGSGRAADALVSSLRGTSPTDDEMHELRERVDREGLTARPELLHVFDLDAGPGALTQLLERILVAR